MATYILKWNPAISSYKMIDFLYEIKFAVSGGEIDMNWSVWDYEKIRKGDCVYLLKVGLGTTGIVAKGKVTSKAYQADDWSGKGRTTYYVDFTPLCMVSPDVAHILTTQTLEQNIADFDWTGGHSGLLLTPDQESRLDTLWNDYVISTFGSKPQSNPGGVYFKTHKRARADKPRDLELANLGISLFNAIEQRRRHPQGYDHTLYSKGVMETAAWLLKNIPDTASYAYCNLECAKSTPWDDPDFLIYLQNAVRAFHSLMDDDVKINVDLADLDKTLSERQKYAEYISQVEEKAEHGELPDNLRDLIEGYDEINVKIGSFHDSELLGVCIDHEQDYVELKLYMCNGADDILTIRFEGDIEYEISGDGECDCIYLHWGYFHRIGNRVRIHLEPFGEISANRLRLISIDPAPQFLAP